MLQQKRATHLFSLQLHIDFPCKRYGLSYHTSNSNPNQTPSSPILLQYLTPKPMHFDSLLLILLTVSFSQLKLQGFPIGKKPKIPPTSSEKPQPIQKKQKKIKPLRECCFDQFLSGGLWVSDLKEKVCLLVCFCCLGFFGLKRINPCMICMYLNSEE